MGDFAGDVDNVYWPKAQFFVYEPVPTLLNIASHEVALRVWNQYLSRPTSRTAQQEKNVRDYLRVVFRLKENYKLESDKLIESLKTERRIEEILKNSLNEIRCNMENWSGHFENEIFGLRFRSLRIELNPNQCVWRQNGEVDYKRSASKVVSEGNLDAEIKFEIMCFYCLTDELKTFPVSSVSEQFIQQNYSNFEILYWILYLEDQLDMLKPILSAAHQCDENASIDANMAVWCSDREFLYYPCEYFWNCLNEDEQVSVAAKILHDSELWHLQKMMLSKMSRALIEQIPIELMTNFIVQLGMPENAFVVWSHVKDQITELQFVTLWENILEIRFSLSEKCVIILNNIWDTASERLKKRFFKNETCLAFSDFMDVFQCSSNGLALVMKILSSMNKRTRKEIIIHQDFGNLLDSVDDFDAFSNILELCLPEESDRLRFKNSVIESHIMVEYFMMCAEYPSSFDTFAKQVVFYSPNAEATRKFINKSLRSDEFDKVFIVNGENWKELINFIHAVFPNNLSTACKEMKHLILSKEP